MWEQQRAFGGILLIEQQLKSSQLHRILPALLMGRELGKLVGDVSFKSSTGVTLGNGEALANFQIFGRRCSWKEVLIILQTGKANCSAYSLTSQFGILPWLPTLEGCHKKQFCLLW